eukprot:scaffold77711_cov19-Tisochrysis_lutea.AAC.1
MGVREKLKRRRYWGLLHPPTGGPSFEIEVRAQFGHLVHWLLRASHSLPKSVSPLISQAVNPVAQLRTGHAPRRQMPNLSQFGTARCMGRCCLWYAGTHLPIIANKRMREGDAVQGRRALKVDTPPSLFQNKNLNPESAISPPPLPVGQQLSIATQSVAHGG